MLEAEREAKDKARLRLDEFACELELALECLKGLPVGDDWVVTAVERSGQPPTMQVRVLLVDPSRPTMKIPTPIPGGSVKLIDVPANDTVLIGFTAHRDPQSGRSWFAYGSQSVTAEEAVHLGLDEIERRQK